MGPTLFIYLPAPMNDADAKAIHNLLLLRDSSLHQDSKTSWRFWLAPDTCQASLAIVPFGAESDGSGGSTEIYMEPDEQSAYSRALGYTPQAAIQLDNFCRNDPLGHQLLGRLAALLARQFSGAIEVGGVDPGLSPRSGAVVRVPLTDGTTIHLIDSRAMEAWTWSKTFHLEI